MLTAIKNISEEFGRGLYLGARNPETDLPKMIQKMKKAGLDNVLAEMQKQLDAWWTKNHKD